MTKMMKCPACRGTGEVEVGLCEFSINQDIGEQYQPELGRSPGNFWQYIPLSCLLGEGHLEEWHEDYIAAPCTGCGGWDMHTNWCPTPEITSNWNTTIAFDDDGWFWVVPPGADADLAPEAPKQLTAPGTTDLRRD